MRVMIGKGLASLSALRAFGMLLAAVVIASSGPARAQAAFMSATRYDAMGRVTGTISPDPDGSGTLLFGAVRNTYDGAGRLTKVEKGELSNWKAETIAPAAWGFDFAVLQTLETSYDSQSRKTKEVLKGDDGSIQTVTQYSYDRSGQLICTAVRMDPGQWASQPDACVPQTTGYLGADRITKNIYDAAGQLLQVREGVGTSVEVAKATYSYTPNGKKEYVIDANGNRAQFVYDGHDRLSQWIFPSTTRPTAFNDSSQANALASAGQLSTTDPNAPDDYEAYSYDPNGNRLTFRTRANQTLSYSYDALNRMTNKGGPIADVNYAYDSEGHQLSATFTSGGAGVTNTYNSFGELKTTTANYQGPALTITYDYDPDGNRWYLKFPDNQEFTYSYDGLDRQNGLYQGQWAASLTTLQYDRLGRRAALARTGAGATSYTYDKASRLASLANDFTGTNSDHTLTFGYNTASQIIAKAASNDAFVWTGGYNVNRAYTTNGLNQYSAAGGDSFTYDGNGNLATNTTPISPTATATTTFTYDAENRLTGASGLINGSLGYDPTGRMVVASSPSSWTRLLYDGDDLLAEFNSSGTLLRRYLHGPGEDEPLVQYEGADLSAKRFFHADQQGSVIALTDSAGATTYVNKYDEYGVPQNTNSGRFQYTGQQYVPELGMYYYKARFYSPTLGRFMQRDPIGYDDQTNLYAYVGDDPTNLSDPSGLSWWTKLIKLVANGGNVASTLADVSENVATIRNPSASPAEKFGAGIAIASEAAPISVGDVKAAGRVTRGVFGGLTRKQAYGNPSSSAAAKAARRAGEGQPCSGCGKTMQSGTSTAPQAQHDPPLSDHFRNGPGAEMTATERKAYARSPEAINGARCATCQRAEGREQQRKYSESPDR